MHNNLEEVLSEQQSQGVEPKANLNQEYYHKYYQIESTQGRDGHEAVITPTLNEPQPTNHQVQKPYQLRLPVIKNEEVEAERVATRQGKRSRVIVEKVEQNNPPEIPVKEKSSNILKLYDLQNEDEEIQEVLVIKTTQVQSAAQIKTIPLESSPPNEKINKKQHEEQPRYHNSFLLQSSKETVEKEPQFFKKTLVQTSKPKTRYIEQNVQIKKEEPQQDNKRSRLFDVSKGMQANMKKGLFYQSSNDDDYVVLPQFNSRSQLDTGLQITSSRDQFSSREILDNKSLVFKERGSRKRLPALQPINKVMNIGQKKLFQPKSAEKQEASPEKQKNLVLLKNGKFAVLNQDIQDVYQFIRKPIAFDRVLESTIVRNKTCQKLFYMDYDLLTNQAKYLLSCKKMPFHFGSTYNLSLMQNQFQQQSEYFIGKIEANFVGSIFNIFTPKTQDSKELQLSATVYYSPDFTCCKLTAREIEVYIKNQSYLFQQLEGSGQKGKNLKQLYLLQPNRDRQKIKRFVNKKPVWRQYLQAFVLNFRGKSKFPSVKNMVLVNPDDQRQEGLLLAKKASNQFFLDISYPFTPLIGFAVAITAFDFKLASQ